MAPPPLGGAGGRKAGRTSGGGACRLGSLALIALALAVTLSGHLFISRSASAAEEGTAAVAASAAHLQTQLERLLKENGELHGSLAEAQERLAEADAQLRVARELAARGGGGGAGATREACEAAGFAKASCPACVCNCPGKTAAIPGASCACDSYAAAVDPSAVDPAVRGPLAEGAKSPPLGCAPSRGLYEDKVDKLLYLPPDYCDVDAGTAGASAENDGVSHFERLDPASVTYNADGACHWGALYAWKARPDVAMCTHDPDVDMQVSTSIHKTGGWLKSHELSALEAVACSPERPFMLDIGSNLGAFSVIAAAKGCHVVLLDPIKHNLGRAVESIRRLGALGNATFYRNAAGSTTKKFKFGFNPSNPGASAMLRGSTADETTEAFTVKFDDFWALPDRPVHPATGKPMQPADVAFVKVDAEGFDIEVYYSLQRVLQVGHVPFLTIEFNPKMMDAGSVKCDALKFVQHMYSIGYRFYSPEEPAPKAKRLWTVLQDVEFDSFRDKPTTVPRRSSHRSNMEWWFVHETAIDAGHLPPGWLPPGDE